MITVNGWFAGGKGGGFSQWGRWGKVWKVRGAWYWDRLTEIRLSFSTMGKHLSKQIL